MDTSIRILVVDDDPDIVRGAARVLERENFTTETAETGEEALQAVSSFRPDLVLLDRDLPGLNGVEVCQRIKQNPESADTFVVMISGTYTEGSEQADGLDAGADGYLVRPIGNRELAARINAYVRTLELMKALRYERRKVEEQNAELAKSEERFRATFEQAAVGIAHVGTDGRWLRVNRRLCDIVGYSKAELLQLTFQDITHPEDLDADLSQMQRLLAGEIDTYTMEKRYLRKDSSEIWINLTVSLVREASGEPLHFISVIEDISERKAAEEELEETRAILQTAMDHSQAGIAIADAPDGRLRYVNPAGLFIRGKPAADVVNGVDIQKYVESWKILHHDGTPYRPEDVPLARAILHGEVCSEEFIIRRADTEDVIVLANAAPIRGASGAVRAAVVIFLDVTERRRAEEALVKSQERLDLIIKGSQDAPWDWDLVSNELYYSPQWWGQLGYVPDELPADAALWERLLHPDDGAQVEAVFGSALKAGSDSYEVEFRLQHKDGHYVPVLSRGFINRNAAGEPVRVSGTNMDLTTEKALEAEQESLRAQLAQAGKLESVGRLAGGVAHDFNNMLTVILGQAEVVLEGLDPDHPIAENLRQIQGAAERSAGLTRQLLAFARKQTIAPRVLDPNRTVEELLSMLRPLLGENLELSWRPATEAWSVKLDPSQLEQMLTNLCVNARDAIADVGKVTIETGNRTFDAAYCAQHAGFLPGEYVLLAVSDDGCGMDRDTLDQVFEPFFTTKKVGQGTGLGLATVYGIVKQNSGFVNVYSEPGEGTTFRIYLPRHTAAAGGVQPAAPAARCTPGHETVLLVEDEPAILAVIAGMLTTEGYTVLPANTPGEALRLAREHTGEIHLLLTDVVMPEMNGRDLARQLLSLYPGLKRLFMSGYTANVIAHHGVLDPGVHFLEKPFSKQVLTTKVREALTTDDGAPRGES